MADRKERTDGYFGSKKLDQFDVVKGKGIEVMPIRGDDRELWARQPKETRGNFDKFEVFLKQDALKRTKKAVAAHFDVTGGLITILAKRWSWNARIEAWDAHCAREARAEDLKGVLEMRRAQRIAGQRMRKIGFQQLELIEKKLEAGKELTPNEARLMIDAGFKHEAASLGQSAAPEEVQHKFDDINVEKLTDEQLHRIIVKGEDPKKVLAPELNAMDGMKLH